MSVHERVGSYSGNLSVGYSSVIERGCTLQFRCRPPHFNGVVQSLTLPRNAQVLRQKVCCLLKKGAVVRVQPSELESGFYSRYFVVPKRDGGLCPILDLRPINRALCKRLFRMITLKQILAQIRPGDWFASVDLKNAYFHIQITLHHKRFLRFAFEGTAYQYSVLPFGLALAPRTFSKCLNAALSPLRASGMRILNYLHDWLILAPFRDTLLRYIDTAASSLGVPRAMCQHAEEHSRPESVYNISGGVLRLCGDAGPPLSGALGDHFVFPAPFQARQLCSREEISEAAGSNGISVRVCHLGLLHMHPLQLWLKSRVPWTVWTSGRLSIAVSHGYIEALRPWCNTELISRGVPLGLVTSCVPIDLRLGSSVRGHANFGAVVRTAEPVAHKLLGAGSSVLSSKGFSTAAGTAACTDLHRQHVCSFLYKSPMKHSFQTSV